MLSHRGFTIVVFGLISLNFIFKKSLEELKSVSYVFLTVLALFITLLFVDLTRQDASERESLAEMNELKVDANLFTAISIILFAYAYQFMVFPAYVELENRSNNRFEKVNLLTLAIYSVALILTGIFAVMIFGKSLKTDLLENMATQPGALSIMIRGIYTGILLLHLPYIFFTLKEYTLVMYEEVTSRTLS